MAADLVIVVSNDQPSREEQYPRTWLLYREGQGPVEVHAEFSRVASWWWAVCGTRRQQHTSRAE
jgi:hypothetical protein